MNLNSTEDLDENAGESVGLTGMQDDGLLNDGESPAGLDLSMAKAKRRVSMTNIVVAIVLVVSASSLYLMRKQGKGAGMTFQVSKIDYELEKAVQHNSDQQRILAELARTGHGSQLQVDRIQKNPFQLETDGAVPTPVVAETDLDRRRRAERREQEIAARVAGLQLNGILGGSVPLARIGGETVRVGDMVAGTFVVTAIDPEMRSVELMVDGATHSLSMAEAGQQRRPAGRAR